MLHSTNEISFFCITKLIFGNGRTCNTHKLEKVITIFLHFGRQQLCVACSTANAEICLGLCLMYILCFQQIVCICCRHWKEYNY